MASADENGQGQFDETVRALVAAHDTTRAATLAIRALGPELLGFLSSVLGNHADADEVFSVVSIRLWRSLEAFKWRCSLRTWAYVIARNEVSRFRGGAKKHLVGRVQISDLSDVIAAVQTESRATLRSEEGKVLSSLRDSLPGDDRALLVLRVDRGLSWQDIALTFLDDPENCSREAHKREAARVRQRFQTVKRRLGEQARTAGLLPR